MTILASTLSLISRPMGCVAIACFASIANLAAGESVEEHELFKNRSGYPCVIDIRTDEGNTLSLQLSDNKNIWSLGVNISNREEVYREFFDAEGLYDRESFETTFRLFRIGERTVDFHKASLFEVNERDDIDEKTIAVFSINGKHSVTKALTAMSADGLQIEGLVSVDDTVDALNDFRFCSYAALGLEIEERVESDTRAEYRVVFERAFENWVESMAKAEQCLVALFDDDAVNKVIEEAAAAFYPGTDNDGRRSSYREELNDMLPFAKRSGMIDARTGSCAVAGTLADMAQVPVDRALQKATELD